MEELTDKINSMLNSFFICADMCPNVRRYVALAQSRGGACFCTRCAMQVYNVDLFILALAKTVTPAGAPGGSRGGLCRCTPNGPIWLEISRGTEGNAIYRLVRYCSGFLI